MICSRLTGSFLALSAFVFGQTAPPKAPIDLEQKHKELKLYGDRFRPLTWEEMNPAQKKMIDDLLTGDRGTTTGPFNVELRSPVMGDLNQKVGEYLRFHTSMPLKLNEFAIILTGRYWTAQYEYFAHRIRALQAGLSPSIVEAVTEGRRPTGMQPDEETVYNFVQELLYKKQVSDATFKAAKDRFGEQGVVDTIAITGYYQMVCSFLNVDRYPIPSGDAPPLKPLASQNMP